MEELGRIASAAMYPFMGMWFFLCNSEFWPLSVRHLPWDSFLSFTYYPVLNKFLFPPQYELFLKFHGSGAFLSAFILTLSECLVLIQFLHGGYHIDQGRVDAFDVGDFCKKTAYNSQGSLS